MKITTDNWLTDTHVISPIIRFNISNHNHLITSRKYKKNFLSSIRIHKIRAQRNDNFRVNKHLLASSFNMKWKHQQHEQTKKKKKEQKKSKNLRLWRREREKPCGIVWEERKWRRVLRFCSENMEFWDLKMESKVNDPCQRPRTWLLTHCLLFFSYLYTWEISKTHLENIFLPNSSGLL